ncbi:hypothetical protein ACOMHN_020198 [Nucella lapillus]
MELDDPPTKDQVARAIAQLQCGKSAGPDSIPPEVFKAGSQPLIQKFTEFLCMCWEDGCLPQDLKDARIVHLYKGKGDKSSCDNYRGISLLSIAGGHRPRGRPKLRYKDTMKKSLQKCDIDEKRWEFLATNRSEWRQAIRKGTEAYENERQVSQVEKRAAVKVRLNCAERTIKCPLCSRLCASDFGPRSHMRVHK